MAPSTRTLPHARRQRRFSPKAVGVWALLFLVVLSVSALTSHLHDADQIEDTFSLQGGSRRLLSSGGADDWNPVHTEQKYNGPLGWPGIFLWVPMTIWIFSGVAIAADEYFQPALESISDALDLSPDVRGATFLAAASSAPEFFTSFADTFLVSDDGGAGFGVGTIVGSAVFNVLIIVALSTIPTLNAGKELEKAKPQPPAGSPDMKDEALKKAESDYKYRLKAWENKKRKLEEEGSYLPIDWYPLARDTVFYSISIVLLVSTVATHEPEYLDKKPHVKEGCVEWYESLVYIIVYTLYILYMMKSADYREYAERLKKLICRCESKKKSGPIDMEEGQAGPLDPVTTAAELQAKESTEAHTAHTAADDDKSKTERLESESDDDDDEDDSWLFDSLFEFDDEWGSPSGLVCNFMSVLTIPFHFLFKISIPNVNRPAMKQHYILSFGMCILWIGFLSAMMVKTVSWIGSIISLHPVVMGLVVLAAGTSVPDALGSYNEAKNGNADAAVSNALGSNVFDICMGLGVPWFVFSLAKGRCFSVPAEEILIPTFILFFILFMFIGTLVFFQMRLYGKVGIVYLCIYIIFVIWVLVNGTVLNIKL